MFARKLVGLLLIAMATLGVAAMSQHLMTSAGAPILRADGGAPVPDPIPIPPLPPAV
jgi:hypothetical protein